MSKSKDLGTSWDRNAGNWTRAVREGEIPSRRAGTDAAILEAIAARRPKRLLDAAPGRDWNPPRLDPAEADRIAASIERK